MLIINDIAYYHPLDLILHNFLKYSILFLLMDRMDFQMDIVWSNGLSPKKEK